MAVSPENKERLEQAKAFMAQLRAQSTDEVVAAMQQTKTDFMGEINGLSPEQIDFKPAPDRWSIREIALHVSNSMRNIGYMAMMLGAGQLKMDPKDAKPGALDPDPGDFDQIRKMVDEGFDVSLKQAREADAVANPDATFPHPWFGEFTARDWAVFNVLHGNVHVNQVKKNKDADGYPA